MPPDTSLMPYKGRYGMSMHPKYVEMLQLQESNRPLTFWLAGSERKVKEDIKTRMELVKEQMMSRKKEKSKSFHVKEIFFKSLKG